MGLLPQNAVVFAPHPDDETLGCGGTVLRKREHGADITIIFMTDGARSHSKYLSARQLRELRKREAQNAAAVLGITDENLIFLDYPNSDLRGHHADAVKKIKEIASGLNPAQVFIPHRLELHDDHRATSEFVYEALTDMRYDAKIFEYPVWCWSQWPWIKRGRNIYKQNIRDLIRRRFGLSLMNTFTDAVDVNSYLELKRKALNQHETQMKKMYGIEAWPTLGEVSDGEFLEIFFSGYECFRIRESRLHLKAGR